MQEIDVFAHIIETYGSPISFETVSPDVVSDFVRRVPAALLLFWKHYGWCHFKDSYFWICDPRPFDAFLNRVFQGDMELDAADMTVIAYTAFNNLKIWHRSGRTILINMEKSELTLQNCRSVINPSTGETYSHDYLSGCLINDEMIVDTEYFELACNLLGRPAYGECFAYVPALQLGGQEDLDNLHRVRMQAHIDFLAQLEPLKLVELTGSQPGFPMGRVQFVRLIGSRR